MQQFSPDDPDLGIHREHLRQLRLMAKNELLSTEAELAAWGAAFVADGAPNADALRNERVMRIAALTQNASNLAAKLAYLDAQINTLTFTVTTT